MPYTYKYPRSALSVDNVVFGIDDGGLQILLIERNHPPFQGQWALPGGFVEENETLETAAVRELQEETGLKRVYVEQLGAYSEPNRDPRERVITFAFLALVNKLEHTPKAASDARDAAWHDVDKLPKLAFDHRKIVQDGLDALRTKIHLQPIGFELLPLHFTMKQLQRIYEVILGKTLDKRNFRRKILDMGFLKKLDETEPGVPHRAAHFYFFDRKRYQQLVKEGFYFEI